MKGEPDIQVAASVDTGYGSSFSPFNKNLFINFFLIKINMQCRMLVVIVLCCAAARSGSVRFPDEPQYHSLPHDQRKQPDFHFPSVRFPSDSNPDLDPGKAPSNLAGKINACLFTLISKSLNYLLVCKNDYQKD